MKKYVLYEFPDVDPKKRKGELGTALKVEFKDQEFQTFLMFQSMRRKGPLESFPVPIQIYSGWKMSGAGVWDDKAKAWDTVPKTLVATPGVLRSPATGENWRKDLLGGPSWTVNYKERRYMLD